MSLVSNIKSMYELFGVAIRTGIKLIKYNPYNVAEYFRKQGATIGEGCRLDIGFLAQNPYLVIIGNHVFVAQGVTFHTHDGGSWILKDVDPDFDIFGPIIIEDNCLIGSKAHILPNVRIGKNSIVGAGSVVISNVPPDSIVMGIPARIIGSSIKYRERCLEVWKTQRPPGYEKMNSKQKLQALEKQLMSIYASQLKL